VVNGKNSNPLIKANVIETNRKSGIKLTEGAQATIGGETLDDLDVNRCRLDFKLHMTLYQAKLE